MKRVLSSVALSVALLVPAGAAIAASPDGAGTVTIRYQSAEYFDFVIGATVICTGIHQYGPRWPGDATSGGRDVYRCRSQSGPFENASHEDGLTYEPGGWVSDYFFDHQGGIFVPNTEPMTLRISGDNLSYHTIAVFAEQ